MPGFNIGGGSAEDPSSTKETHRSHRWRIETLGELQDSSRNFLYAKTLQLPNFTVDEEIYIGASVKYKFAKSVNWEDVTISFYDVFGLYEQVIGWQNLVYTPSEGVKSAESYKKETRLVMIGGNGQQTGPRYVLKNSWPKSVSHSPLSYESSEIKLLTVVLSYDYVDIQLGGGGASVAT